MKLYCILSSSIIMSRNAFVNDQSGIQILPNKMLEHIHTVLNQWERTVYQIINTVLLGGSGNKEQYRAV